MHKLSTVKITNFKSIKNSDFILSDFTPIIGYNNAGKSNILDAIYWLLKKSTLSSNFFNNPQKNIEIIGEISGITDDIIENLKSHKKSVENYIFDNKLTIKRVHPKLPCKISDIKLYILNNKTKEWNLNPTGIDQALKVLYPEPIVIKAMDNTEEDIDKFKTSSSIGKLINEIITPIEEKYSKDINNCMSEINKILSINGEKRAPELEEFDNNLNTKLNKIFPELKLKLDISTPNITELFKSGNLKIIENGDTNKRGIKDFGAGTKRIIQISLIRQLSEIKKNQPSNSTTLLLIDEPELFLHPQAIEQLRISLNKLSSLGYQIIFTTHSGQMISSDDISKTIILRKSSSKGTYPKKTLYEAIEEIEKNHENQLELLFNLSNSIKILFSEKIILAEGKTEMRLLPFLYEKITEHTFLLDKICIIGQGGANNTSKTQKILKTMGLDPKAIVDLDFVFTNGIKLNYLEKDDPDIVGCKNIMKELEKEEKMKLNPSTGLPQKWKEKKAEYYYSILANNKKAKQYIINLHKKMKLQNIWIWKTGAIESQLNLSEKNEKTWAKFKDTLKNKSISEIKTLYPGLVKLFDWIVS